MKIWHEVWDYVKMIIIVVAIVLVINNVVLINAKIPSPSMEKTIMTGDRIFGFRLAYGINLDLFGHEISKKVKDPERFDIVIFKYPDDESQLFIKRVIGLPGETIQISGGRILIDGEAYKEGKDFPMISNPGLASSSITLESGEYFVLGDNRNNSEDSRYADIGMIKKRYIAGKIWFTCAPFEKLGFTKG